MKKIFFSALCVMLSASVFANVVNVQINPFFRPTDVSAGQPTDIEGCNYVIIGGQQICNCPGGSCDYIEPHNQDYVLEQGNIAATLTATTTGNGTTLTLDLSSKDVSKLGAFQISDEITLSSDLANALGFRSVVISPAAYSIDYSTNPYGTIHLHATIQ